MFRLLGKKIITFLRSKYLLNWTYDKVISFYAGPANFWPESSSTSLFCVSTSSVASMQIRKFHELKIAIIFLPINLNM